MNKKNTSINPIFIDKNNWYYVEDKKVCFVHEVLDKEGKKIKADIFFANKKKLVKSLISEE